jgi:hypothetical protein
MSEYGRANGKITIKSLDDGTEVKAQYNPKELQIDRTVPWSPTGEANKSNASNNSHGIHLEFTGAQARTLSVELLFDGYETKAGSGFHVKVEKQVALLEHLASVRKPGSKKEDERRPHWCVASWGSSLKAFRCVIESLSTKYTMFDSDGNPLRATCTVKLKEADKVKASSGNSGGGDGGGGGGGGGGGE